MNHFLSISEKVPNENLLGVSLFWEAFKQPLARILFKCIVMVDNCNLEWINIFSEIIYF